MKRILTLFLTAILSSSLIAGDDERAPQSAVGDEDATPVYADELNDGTYEIEVESSSSMFKIVDASLTVEGSEMTAVLTLSGTGYTMLFMGTGEEAVAADESEYSQYIEDASGAYTYEVAVPALNTELECTGFSRRKEKWYDHQIFFDASTLPASAFRQRIDLKNGVYRVDVALSGGSGKASVESPARLEVRDGQAALTVIWSSPNYDYMLVDGVKYTPVNFGGNSEFRIPVDEFDAPLPVVGDTTAMSEPHEIEYTLTLSGASVKRKFWSSFAFFFRNLFHHSEKDEESETAELFIDREIGGNLTFLSRDTLGYATCFAIDRYSDDTTLLSVADGSRYLILPKGLGAPSGLDSDITVLPSDASNIYLVASNVADYFDAAGVIDRVRFSGTEEKDWTVNSIASQMASGQTLYAGKYSAPDYELLLSDGCDLAIENTMILHTPEVLEKLAELSVPAIIDYSSYESEPLGRSEWVKFYGVLTGAEKAAETAFLTQEEAMTNAAASGNATGKTVAFFYLTEDGRAVVRRSDDYVPRMIEAAGGSYVFSDLTGDDRLSTESVTIERFYAAAKDADVLIYNASIVGDLTSIAELLGKSELLSDFAAVQTGEVYCTGSNLYQHPMALGDVTGELHSILTEGRGGAYFTKLEAL